MCRFGRKLEVLALFAFLTIGSGCTGFFVNPTLSSLAIGPQDQTITTSQTLQMSATGTFSDGSTKDLTGKVNWSSDTPTCATINSSGLVTPVKGAIGICKTTISAASGTATAATTTVTVTEGTPTSITLSVKPSTTPTHDTTVTFTALAIFPGTGAQQDITSSVTWNNSDPTDLPLTQGSGSANLSATSAGKAITVSATFDNVTSNSITLNVQ
jgi:hypothetical protein